LEDVSTLSSTGCQTVIGTCNSKEIIAMRDTCLTCVTVERDCEARSNAVEEQEIYIEPNVRLRKWNAFPRYNRSFVCGISDLSNFAVCGLSLWILFFSILWRYYWLCKERIILI
jgi:hypothetical protein